MSIYLCCTFKTRTETLEVEFEIFHFQPIDSHAPDSFNLSLWPRWKNRENCRAN